MSGHGVALASALLTAATLCLLKLAANVEATTSPTFVVDPVLNCRTFDSIYGSGKNLCEKIFSNSYAYVPTSSPTYSAAYTMWFFTAQNPNVQSTAKQVTLNVVPSSLASSNQCLLKAEGYVNGEYEQEFKATLSPEANMTECQPFSQNSCCAAKTVASPSEINQAYGPEYRWDRCGKLSESCERFFVQEACFYQCDQSPGFFRMFPVQTYNASDPNQNQWQILNMPIKGDYCDAWFEACRYDNFCSDGGGDFFSCAKAIENEPVAGSAPASLSGGGIAGVTIGATALVALAAMLAFMIMRERRGDPLFEKIHLRD